ncbi:hypothetical protein ABVK25_002173 [Lepraria finkii]|uniref:Protein kinase domain-containing protein n=1 Tax=Lepraria finkii TaxID=1340010 RepID=A0ABR4BIZ4_9LECA
MVDPIGAAIGAASLTIQLLDGCVKGYQYFVAAAGMPDDCHYMRTRLQIEYLRLLDWTEVAGLIEYKDGQDLPDSLKSDRFVLVAVLTEIRSSMEDLAEINGKYIELRPEEDPAKKKEALELELVEQFSNISLAYEKKAGKRTYPRGLNHIARSSAMAKDVVRHPKRLKWVAFDRDVFKKLLGRLTELNDYLHEMMHGHQARALEVATQRTYLEMLQVRVSVDELKHLVTAAMLLQDRDLGEPSSSSVRRRNEKALASLAEFKTLNAANEASFDDKPPAYDSIVKSTQLNYSSMTIFYENTNASDETWHNRTRTEGKYYPGDGTEHHIWIEWKTYEARRDRHLNKDMPIKENVKRVKELVALLQSDKPKEFCAPRCLGFFDDRDDKPQSDHDYRFGLVFEKSTPNTVPKSLHRLLTGPKPSLTDRISLAHRIATCVLYLHAVNWLHKALRSDSVLFFSNEDRTTLPEPYLTGFEYARPDKNGETSTGGEVNDWWQLYVHPNYQGSSAKGTYRKMFDIYSLGIILLEISYWKRVEDIVGIDPDVATTQEMRGIRQKLLRPDFGYLAQVRADHGDRYHDAVRSCIEGGEAFGVGEEESEGSIETGAKLQRGFMTCVVDALERISV